ncbi:branched-chain amino acid ABC transporter permease [Alcaligenaceae bacterium B3P038]|nr:branched-chain amino acid ABC transporter permease [Alcaligenaceae bacterium B3P038]
MNLRDLIFIVLFAVGVSVITLVTSSGVWLTFIMMSLYAALLSQAWNILGGYAGQLSFGHALFFGVGAYTQAVAQLSGGINPWVGLVMAIVAGVIVALIVGALTFRYGLKGSYFALVTLAFAEVFRILALSASFTGGGVGLMVPLRGSIANMQFASRHGYIFLLLAFVVAALLVTAWLRHSRTGAYMQAVRDNEDAARAVGVNPFQVKLKAIALSAAFMSVAGAFYVQVFQYIDPGIAFGPAVSVEALVGAIVGGVGTLWGPILGAVVLHLLSDVTRNMFGEIPGISMVIYGTVLVLIVMFMPRGVAGSGVSIKRLFSRGGRGNG